MIHRTNFFSGREVDFGNLASTEVQEIVASSTSIAKAFDRSTDAEQYRLLQRNNHIEMGMILNTCYYFDDDDDDIKSCYTCYD